MINPQSVYAGHVSGSAQIPSITSPVEVSTIDRIIQDLETVNLSFEVLINKANSLKEKAFGPSSKKVEGAQTSPQPICQTERLNQQVYLLNCNIDQMHNLLNEFKSFI